MRRLVVDIERLVADGGRLELDEDEQHYLRRVLRLAAGDRIELRDGLGGSWEGTLRAGTVEYGRKQPLAARAGPEIHLLFGLPKGKRLEVLLEKATELAVHRLCPLITRRTVRHPREGGRPHERWQRLVRAAVRQSGVAYEPRVEPLCTLQAALASPVHGLKLLAAPDAPRRLRDCLPAPAAAPVRRVSLLTGPEGGLTPEEVELAVRAGFMTFRFGDGVLRAETAPIVGLALLQHRLGDLG